MQEGGGVGEGRGGSVGRGCHMFIEAFQCFYLGFKLVWKQLVVDVQH
jgi:hypothetical protein